MKKTIIASLLSLSLLFAREAESIIPSKLPEAPQGVYEIYMTQNVYNFLVLNSQTGNVFQCQWGENSMCLEILPSEKAKKNIQAGVRSLNRFKLYPTQNMWTYIMLDTVYGAVYHVQFTTKGDEYRFIQTII